VLCGSHYKDPHSTQLLVPDRKEGVGIRIKTRRLRRKAKRLEKQVEQARKVNTRLKLNRRTL